MRIKSEVGVRGDLASPKNLSKIEVGVQGGSGGYPKYQFDVEKNITH